MNEEALPGDEIDPSQSYVNKPTYDGERDDRVTSEGIREGATYIARLTQIESSEARYAVDTPAILQMLVPEGDHYVIRLVQASAQGSERPYCVDCILRDGFLLLPLADMEKPLEEWSEQEIGYLLTTDKNGAWDDAVRRMLKPLVTS